MHSAPPLRSPVWLGWHATGVTTITPRQPSMNRSCYGQALVIGRSLHNRSPDWENSLAFTARRRRRPPSSERSIPSPMRQATSFCSDARDLPVTTVTARRRGRAPPSARSDLPICEPPARLCHWRRRSLWPPRSPSRRARLRHPRRRQLPDRSRRDPPRRIVSGKAQQNRISLFPAPAFGERLSHLHVRITFTVYDKTP